MFSRKIRFAAIAAATALSAGVANAENNWIEVDSETLLSPFDMTATALEEYDVYDRKGNKIGEVDEVIGIAPDDAGALVIDFEDGTEYDTIVGETVVPLDQFDWVDEVLILKADPKAVSSMEKYKNKPKG